MKRYMIWSVFFCFVAMPFVHGQDIAPLFADMPDEQSLHLETAWRKDLIDLYNSGKPATLKNTMNGMSSLLKLTDDYLLLQSTERSTVEMKLLPLINNTHIICVVTTVYGPIADSRVAFYTTEWKPLDAQALFTPVTADWFIREDVDKTTDAYKDAISRLDMELIQYSLNEKELTLTATYTTPQYLSREDREKTAPFLKETPKVLTWDRSAFR